MFARVYHRGFLVAAALGAVMLVAYLAWTTRPPRGRLCRIGIRNQAAGRSAAVEGRLDALAVDVVSEAARRAGVRLLWIDSPEGPEEAIRSHKVDLWPLFADLPGRRKFAHITDPWLAGERCVLTTGPPRAQWRGVPVSYGLGFDGMISADLPGARPVHKEGEVAAIQAMCRGETAAAAVLVQSLGPLILGRPAGCENAAFRVTPLPRLRLQIGIGSTMAAAAAADELRDQIGNMAADGTLSAMFGRYAVYSTSESEVLRQLTVVQRRSRLLAWASLGLVLLIVVLLRQIARVRQARRSAIRANAAKSEFLANVSHEIRTPLNGILGMAELLHLSRLDRDQHDMLSVIHKSSEVLSGIVDDILSFAHLESGRAAVEAGEFDLHKTLGSVYRLFTPGAQAKDLAFTLAIAPDVPRRVRADELHLRQVLANLLSNAIKFTHSGGVRLEASLGAAGDRRTAVLFRVVDTGIGMDAASVARLFTPFNQADSKAARRYGGTGLGLAIAGRLVALMGGAIGVDSHPGSGSAFWFLLPVTAVAQPAGESAPPPPPAPLLPGASEVKGNILIVDDNPVNQIVALRAVRSLGYEGEVASGGEQALQALRGRPFDLVLMDCQMPGMDGYEATARIRRLEAQSPFRKRVPVVAMTASAVDGDRERCLETGMDDYLAKPVRLAALASTLERWLRRDTSLLLPQTRA